MTGTRRRSLTAAVLLLGVLPLVLPSGLVLAFCRSAAALSLRSAAGDCCGACREGRAPATEPAGCCCPRGVPDAPGVDALPERISCSCCVELAVFTGHRPAEPLRVGTATDFGPAPVALPLPAGDWPGREAGRLHVPSPPADHPPDTGFTAPLRL